MFDHLGILIRAANKSLPFYEACLAPYQEDSRPAPVARAHAPSVNSAGGVHDSLRIAGRAGRIVHNCRIVRFHDRWLKRRGGTSHLVVPFEPAFGATEADRCCERGVERAELVQRLRPFRSVHARCASGALRSLPRAGCGCFDGKRGRAAPALAETGGLQRKKACKKSTGRKGEAHTTWLRPRIVGEVKFTEW